MPRKKKLRKAAKQYWIGYPRKSTDTEDKQVHTIADQIAMIRKHYNELPEEDRKDRPLKFMEESRSAFSLGRPVFKQMMIMAEEGQIHGVIVVQPNRISRNHYDTGAFIQALVESKIACLDTTLGKRYTKQETSDIFMLTLDGAISWKDSADKGERIRAAMRNRANEGRVMGPARIGYRNVCTVVEGKVTDRRIEIDEVIAPKVLRIFQFADTGIYSYAGLASEAKKMHLRGRKGAILSASSLEQMIKDPVYKGYYRFMGQTVKARHEAIIPEIFWDHVQLMMSHRRKPSAKPKNLNLRELFVFGSVLKCPKCSHTLSPYQGKGGRYVYYDCKNKQTHCNVRISQATLEGQLQPFLQSVHIDEAEMKNLRDELLKEHVERSGGEMQRRKILESDYAEAQKNILDTFSTLKEADSIGIGAEVRKKIEELKRQRDALQAELNKTHEAGTEWIEKVIRSFDLFKLLQEAMIYGNARTRELCFNAVGSNYSIEGEKLVCKLRSPLRQKAESDAHSSWWAGRDSNPRRRKPPDLQSGPFDHFGTDPRKSDERSCGKDSSRATRPAPERSDWCGTDPSKER
jgi:site-specific DNA recombinase